MSERGSIVIEGVAAMAIGFLLIVVVAQASFLVTARHAAQAAVVAEARRLARVGADPVAEAALLEEGLMRTVPGMRDLSVNLSTDATTAVVHARFRWDPPGPVLVPVWVSVSASESRQVPP